MLNARQNFVDTINPKILIWQDDPELSLWAQYNHKESHKGYKKGIREDVRMGAEDAIWMALKMEEGALSQGIQAASTGWKSPSMDSAQVPPSSSPAPTLKHSPETGFNLLTSGIIR